MGGVTFSLLATAYLTEWYIILLQFCTLPPSHMCLCFIRYYYIKAFYFIYFAYIYRYSVAVASKYIWIFKYRVTYLEITLNGYISKYFFSFFFFLFFSFFFSDMTSAPHQADLWQSLPPRGTIPLPTYMIPSRGTYIHDTFSWHLHTYTLHRVRSREYDSNCKPS